MLCPRDLKVKEKKKITKQNLGETTGKKNLAKL